MHDIVHKPLEPLFESAGGEGFPQIEGDHPVEKGFVPSGSWDLVLSFVIVAFAYRGGPKRNGNG